MVYVNFGSGFSLLFCIVYCSENIHKINITPYGEIILVNLLK